MQLFTALAREAKRCMEIFNLQNFANTAWAFAKVCQADVQLFKALARQAKRRLGDFKP